MSQARPAPGSVVLVDHYDSYTYNLAHLIAEVLGGVPDIVAHDHVELGDLLSYQAVVLSPGPGSPSNEADFAVGREILQAASRPVFGVCLGMQGLVVAFGGRVGPVQPGHGRIAEIEHNATGLFEGIPQRFDAVRYHSLAALKIPDCLEVIGTDAHTGLPMAVTHRSKPLVGVQYHPESILTEHGAQLVANFFDRVAVTELIDR